MIKEPKPLYVDIRLETSEYIITWSDGIVSVVPFSIVENSPQVNLLSPAGQRDWLWKLREKKEGAE